MKYFFAFIILIGTIKLYANDSIRIKTLEYEIEYLTKKISQVESNQLNYQIEKDLIKETYSNNYDTISLILTGVVGFFGLLTFIGFRDVNSLKKEYQQELDGLRILQREIEEKSSQFEVDKKKYDTDINKIVSENEEQNKKIKILEIKGKVSSLIKDKKYYEALEFCIVALEMNPDNIELHTQKGRCNTKLKNYEDSIKTYKKILEIDPVNLIATGDLAEVYLFCKNEKASDEVIAGNQEYFESKINGKLLGFFELIKLFNNNSQDELKIKIEEKIDKSDLETKKNRFEGWDIKDAMIYVNSQKENESRYMLLSYLWYLDGQLNSKELMGRMEIDLEVPKDKENEK